MNSIVMNSIVMNSKPWGGARNQNTEAKTGKYLDQLLNIVEEKMTSESTIYNSRLMSGATTARQGIEKARKLTFNRHFPSDVDDLWGQTRSPSPATS